jgi:uncharacterized RmlC-like cupin family protein
VDVLGPTIVRVPPENSPYDRWLRMARTEMPVLDDLVIDNVSNVALRPWPQMGEGVTGLYLRFADYQIIDGRILELPPGGATVSQRHLYEKGIYFLGGPGHTIIQQAGEEPQRVDWQAGSLFSAPLNVRHQHFNDSDQPVRLLAVTSFPLVLNSFNSERFIADDPFAFTDRYEGDAAFLSRNDSLGKRRYATNFVDDVLQAETELFEIRGKGSGNVGWTMAGNSMISMHVSDIPPQSYKKAHRHSSDAFILLLSGTGYSVTWPEGFYSKRHRVDWQPGTLFVPPTYWYHQHLNTGSTPARFLAINAPGLVINLGLRFEDQLEEDLPEIRAEWQQEISTQQQ